MKYIIADGGLFYSISFRSIKKTMIEVERKMRRSKYGKTYYQKHREACIERAKAWYNAHKEYRRLYMLAYNGK